MGSDSGYTNRFGFDSGGTISIIFVGGGGGGDGDEVVVEFASSSLELDVELFWVTFGTLGDAE